MRKRTLLTGLTLTALLVGGGVDAGFGVPRNSSFDRGARDLQDSWDKDVAAGVPAASISPLREQLASEKPGTGWWSPAWLRDDGSGVLTDLHNKTDVLWRSAVAASRQRANASLTAFTTYQASEATWIPADIAAAAKKWPDQLGSAATPADLDGLAASWNSTLAATKTAVEAAKTAHFTQLLSGAGGRAGLIASARKLIGTANGDNLDSTEVEGLLPAVRGEADNGQDPTPADITLLTAVTALQSLVDLNDTLSGEMRPLFLTVLQTQAEGTPSASSFSDRYQKATHAFQDGRTTAQLTAVQQEVGALQVAIADELRSNSCGHNVGGGKVITINLSLQEMLFFDGGCVVNATPVTTGRPALPTPAGHFRIFYKQTGFVMHSAWPKDSPYWYPDSPTSWVMEFAGGGYFLHDASWEWEGSYGPGSEYSNGSASHGCVHVPTAVMRWAYSWAPYGTPVDIS